MEHHCFTFYMDKVFGLWVWATKKSVSGNRPVCYQRFLNIGVCYSGKVVVGSVGNMLTSGVTRLPVLSVGWGWKAWVSVDQMYDRWRHCESRVMVQIWRKTSSLIGLCNFRMSFLVFVFDSYMADLLFILRLFHFSGLMWSCPYLIGKEERLKEIKLN